MMRVSEVMTKNPLVLNADDNVLIAAQTLAENDIGSVPVAEDGRLLGVVTDRDIVVRAIAQNRAPADTLLKEIVSVEPKYCFEDEDIDHVAQNMDDLLIRRLPVMNRGKKLIGIVSIDDLRPRQSV